MSEQTIVLSTCAKQRLEDIADYLYMDYVPGHIIHAEDKRSITPTLGQWPEQAADRLELWHLTSGG